MLLEERTWPHTPDVDWAVEGYEYRREPKASDDRRVGVDSPLANKNGPRGAQDLSRRCAGAQLFARRCQGAPHAAGRQPGGAPARGRARRAAVRSVVEERHADRSRPHAAELRSAPRAP